MGAAKTVYHYGQTYVYKRWCTWDHSKKHGIETKNLNYQLGIDTCAGDAQSQSHFFFWWELKMHKIIYAYH